MSTTIINADNALRVLKAQMNVEMQAAAEPVIKAAVAEAEKQIRARVAAMVVAQIDRSFSITRYGEDLTIHVKGFGGEA